MTIEQARERAIKEKENGLSRTYTTYDFGHPVKWSCPVRSCCFCAKCTDVFWDYTNGLYMFICDEDRDTSFGYYGQCEWFKDEEETK